jgi:catechol 2,3-dioxygenase-like lactoylglutathione lyase family enzyme
MSFKMKIEHFAFNVSEPLAMAKWYNENLGLKIVSQNQKSPFTTFLADDSGRVMIEIYNNSAVDIPHYHAMHPLLLHLAFVSTSPDLDKNRLLEAGATLVSEDLLADGTHLVMMRDPWGLSIQFCKRAVSMLLKKEVSQ